MFQWTGCKPRRSWLVRWFSAEEIAAPSTKYKPYSAKVTVAAMSEEQQAELLDDIETAQSVSSDNGTRYNLRPRRKVAVYTA